MTPRPLQIIEGLDTGKAEHPRPDESIEPDNHFYSKEYLIATLRRLQKELGRAPTVDDVRNLFEKLPDVSTYERRFGSWIKALKASGIEGVHNRSDETILRQLAELVRRLGRAPTKREVDADPTVASSGLYRSRFGSFGKAVFSAESLVYPMGSESFTEKNEPTRAIED